MAVKIRQESRGRQRRFCPMRLLTMENVTRRLLFEIEKIPLVDPHSHINPHAPCARSLTDLLGYHYYTELAHAAGMPRADLEAGGRELARKIAAWLPRLTNTVQYRWLVLLCHRFFGYTGKDINTET